MNNELKTETIDFFEPSNPQWIIDLCEIFEDFLDARDISINSSERDEYVKECGEEYTARIFGADWDELCSNVEYFFEKLFCNQILDPCVRITVTDKKESEC